MSFLPTVVKAKHQGQFRVHLTFNDGLNAIVDFEPWLAGPVFEPLKEVSYFSRLFVEGGTVVWPNGADIAPETLYEAALAEQSHTRRHPTTARVKEERAAYKRRPTRRRG